MDALSKTGLEWTVIYPGIFLEYYVTGLPTHLTRHKIAVDVDANAAGIPGSGNVPITFTYTFDIAKFVAELLSLEKWEQKYFTVGDSKTWNEVVAIAEQAKGVKFVVSYDPVEKLEKGQITELPGHKKAYEEFGGEAVAKPMVQGMNARFGLWMEEGAFSFRDGAFLNDMFPDIKTLSMEEAWKTVGGKN